MALRLTRKKRRVKKRSRIILLLIILISLSPYLFSEQDNLLEQALALEKEQKIKAAQDLYISWLEHNPDNIVTGEILIHIADLETDPYKAIELLEKYGNKLKDNNQRCIVYSRIALYYEMLGMIAEALAYYQQAIKQDSDQSLTSDIVLKPALLYFAQGDFKAAESWLTPRLHQIADKEDKAHGLVLLAEIYTHTEDKVKAEQTFENICKNYQDTGAHVKGLLFYIKYLLTWEKRDEAEEIFGIMQQKYKNLPEYALAQGMMEDGMEGDVSFYPSPYLLMTTEHVQQPQSQEKKTEEIKAEPVKETQLEQKPVLVLIQVGSFRDPENAHYMLKGLKQDGFNASILERRISGKVYYKVVVGEPCTPEAAQELLIRLKDKAYEGFFLFLED